MRKNIIIIIAVFIFMAGGYILLNIIRSNTFIAKSEGAGYSLCFNDDDILIKEYPGWVPEVSFKVSFIENANSDSFAPLFPAIEVTSPDVTHWVHIVTTTGTQQYTGLNSSLMDTSKDWVFVDVSPQNRNNSIPFYTRGNLFQDNPSWNIPLHSELEWIGKIYALVEDGGSFYPVGGFSWGYRLERWKFKPEAITPMPIDSREWGKIQGLLNQKYKDYHFGDGAIRPKKEL